MNLVHHWCVEGKGWGCYWLLESKNFISRYKFPHFLAAQPAPSGSLGNQAGKVAHHQRLSAEQLRGRKPACRLQSIHSPGSHCTALWNGAVTDTCLRRVGRGRGLEEEGGGKGGGGRWERKGSGREGRRGQSRLLTLPPNPSAKPLSKLILLNERFTWLNGAFNWRQLIN